MNQGGGAQLHQQQPVMLQHLIYNLVYMIETDSV